ncbi:MAG TPA: class I SAM-dependent methyltransferase [Planctomycetota bacterium]|nr:class I SAM-dependent methyltransferase [Planctomycetota bacterium]
MKRSRTRTAASTTSIRALYERHGAAAYYRKHGDLYRNPHERIIGELLGRAMAAWVLRPGRTLDLACGSGEVTIALQRLGFARIDGIDPHTAESYRARTGREAERGTFEQIAAGALSGRRYDLIVCSFALHLVEPSRLPLLFVRLREISETLLVLTPHKRPQVKSGTGWRQLAEILHERVRARLYTVEPVL